MTSPASPVATTPTGETPPTAAGSAREEILARIRRAVADAPPAAQVPRDYARTRPTQDVLSLFEERVADYRAVVERVAPTGVPAAVAGACATYGVRRLAVPPDAPGQWTQLLTDVAVARDGDPAALSADELDGIDAVLTGAAVGIAETGTIVLDAGAAQGRRALSLVPDVHLCVVHAAQVVDDVPAAVARLRPGPAAGPAGPERPAGPLTWISGPSATSDIELDRVEGVHGPRTLHVLVVADAGV